MCFGSGVRVCRQLAAKGLRDVSYAFSQHLLVAVLHGLGTKPAGVRVFRMGGASHASYTCFLWILKVTFRHFFWLRSCQLQLFFLDSKGDVSTFFVAAVSHGLGTKPAGGLLCRIFFGWKNNKVSCATAEIIFQRLDQFLCKGNEFYICLQCLSLQPSLQLAMASSSGQLHAEDCAEASGESLQPADILPDNQLGLEQSDSTDLNSPGETLPVETSKKRKADDLTSEMEAYQNADPTEEGKYSRVLWCNRMPFVISSKTGLIYCGKAVMNRMMLGGSWTVICFSCHCGAQRHRQCSCPCHDLMHYYHSFEPIW